MVLAKGVQTKLSKIMNNLNSFKVNIRDHEVRKLREETPRFDQLIYSLISLLFSL